MIRLRPGVPRWIGVAFPFAGFVLAAAVAFTAAVSASGEGFAGAEKCVVVGVTLTTIALLVIMHNVALKAKSLQSPEE